jgi:hypothetical protein
MVMESTSLTVPVLTKGNYTACCQIETNTMFLFRNKSHYLFAPWSTVLLQLVKKFTTFHGTRDLDTTFTCTRHLSLIWVTSIQSLPFHPTSWTSILIIIPSTSGIFLRFPHQDPVYAYPLLLFMLHALTSFLSIKSPKQHWARNTDH